MRASRLRKLLAYEHMRDGIRVDGKRIAGPEIGQAGWYVVVYEDGGERRVNYDLFLRSLAAASRMRDRANHARAFAPTPPSAAQNALQRWLKARAPHNQRNDDGE